MKMTADVIIIGGGINGCAAAYYLAKRGITDVLVLEADNSIGHGGSSRNGGGVRQSGRDVRELPYAMYAVNNMWRRFLRNWVLMWNITRRGISVWEKQKHILQNWKHLPPMREALGWT